MREVGRRKNGVRVGNAVTVVPRGALQSATKVTQLTQPAYSVLSHYLVHKPGIRVRCFNKFCDEAFVNIVYTGTGSKSS